MLAKKIDTDEAIRQTAHHWRARISAGSMSKAERSAFELWHDSDPAHALAYDRAVTIYSALGEINRGDYRREVFKRLFREHFLYVYRQGIQRLRSKAGATVAIVFAATSAVCAVFILPPLLQKYDHVSASATIVEVYTSKKNDVRTVELSDGSLLTLGAGTEIEIVFSHRVRTARVLSGAVLFNVAKDKARPFSVKAGNLTATVLGTSFDVRNSGGIHRVAVAEGEVEISFPLMVDGRTSTLVAKTQLQAGQQVSASISEGLSKATAVELDDVAAWRDRRLIYKRASIAELVADANRYDDRQVIIDPSSESIGQLRLSGSFRGDNIDRMLLTLQDIHPIDVDTTSEDRVILKRRPEAQ